MIIFRKELGWLDTVNASALHMKKNKEKIKKPTPKVTPPPAKKEEDENPFDFGGLPKRELKKNLGCG